MLLNVMLAMMRVDTDWVCVGTDVAKGELMENLRKLTPANLDGPEGKAIG